MADATPVNRTLLFQSPLDFKADGQFEFAHRDPSVFASKKISSAALPNLSENMMVRNLDELKRIPIVADAMTYVTPKTPHVSTSSFPDTLPSPPTHNGTSDLEDVLHPLMEHDDWEETHRWDESSGGGGGGGSNLWWWPMEVLYQRYHIVIALDMSKATFEVSRNGLPFMDRMASAVDAILRSLAVTLETRKGEVQPIKGWTTAFVPHKLHQPIIEMLWDPKMIVSIVLVNTPSRANAIIHQSPLKHSSDHHTSNVDDDAEDALYAGGRGEAPPSGGVPATPTRRSRPCSATLPHVATPVPSKVGGGAASTAQPPSTPSSNTHVPFLGLSSFPFGAMDDSSDYSVERTFPVVVKCPAEDLMRDATFLPRLQHFLRSFEDMHRDELTESGECDWPEVSVDETIERTLRFVPFDDEYCHSVAIVSNFAVCGCSETIALQESQVLRKNVILSCLSLNRLTPWDSPHLRPLGHFLMAVGGFGLHIDQWNDLARPDLTEDWCQRFEGARCLAQQLLVHLISKFPVAAAGVSQRLHTLIPPISTQPYLIEMSMDVFKREGGRVSADLCLPSFTSQQLLQILTTARINEGWSVVTDLAPDGGHAYLYGRLDHFLHKGSLTLFYEASIVPPIVYRKVRVQGTPALVRFFHAVQLDDRLTISSAQTGRHWHTYLALLRGMLDGWMRADEDVLSLHDGPHATLAMAQRAPQKQTNPLAVATAHASRLPGCTAEWLNRFCIESSVCVLSAAAPAIKYSSESTVSRGLSKRAHDALLLMLKEVVEVGLASLGYRVLQEATSCNTPSAYNNRHSIVVRGGANSDDPTNSLRRGLDVVQAFIVDESSNGGELVAATIEIRHSFAQRTAPQRREALDAVRRALEAFTPATTVPYTGSRAFVLSVMTSCIARRTMCMSKHDLLSKWSDFSGASSSAPGRGPSTTGAPARATQKRFTKHQGAGGVVSIKNTVQYAAMRIFVLGAHGSELFHMRATSTMRWSFGLFVRRTTPLTTTTSLALLMLRREQDGFQILHAHAAGRRVLLRKSLDLPLGKNSRMETVEIHDVLETEFNEGRWDLRVVRHISNYDRVEASMDSVQRYHLIADVRKDYETLCSIAAMQEALTANFCEHEQNATETSFVLPELTTTVDNFLLYGGECDVVSTLQYIVPHLHDANFEKVLELTAPSCSATLGGWELERGIYHVAKSIGDETISLPSVTRLNPEVLAQLRGDRAVLDDSTHMVQVTRLSPRLGLPFLTIIITACPRGRAGDTIAGPTRVLLGTLDAAAVAHSIGLAQGFPTTQLDIQDANAQRARVQARAVTSDKLLLSSLESFFKAFATALHVRTIHRELLHRMMHRSSESPHTPTIASADSTFPAMSLGGSLDTLSTLTSPLPPVRQTSIRPYFSRMIAYSTTADISCLAHMHRRGLITGEQSDTLIAEALQQRQHALRLLPGPTLDAGGPMFLLDWRCGKPSCKEAADVEAPAASWDGGSVTSRCSGGTVKDVGLLETDQVGCLLRLLLHKQYNDPNIQDEITWIGNKQSATGASTEPSTPGRPTPSKMTLTLVALTLADAHFDFSRNRFRPSRYVLHRALRACLENGGSLPVQVATALRASADFGQSTGSTSQVEVNAVDTFFGPTLDGSIAAWCHDVPIPVSRLPEPCSVVLESIADTIALYVGNATLDATIQRSPELRHVYGLIEPRLDDNTLFSSYGEGTLGTMGGTAATDNTLNSSTNVPPIPEVGSLVLHKNQSTLHAVLNTEGLVSLCYDVVWPAFTATKATHQREEFGVEFTRSVRHGSAVDPLAATQQVFSRVLVEEGLCIVLIDKTTSTYMLFPAAAALLKGCVVLVQLERVNNVHVDTARVFCYSPPSQAALARDVAAEVRRFVTMKVAQVSQIHLLRELRERERAPEELIPPYWGDQFPTAPMEAAKLDAGLKRAIFICPGRTVAEIPIYYKLQHQAKAVLAKIVSNSYKMQMYRIYDREQCFVVMDDVAADTFHMLRVVFIKSGGTVPAPSQFPPALQDKIDVCSQIVVQLYSAHHDPQVNDVLKRLQDFCYLLAVQELHTRLKMSMEKDLHVHDWAFLRYEKRNQLTVPMMAGGEPWHVGIRDLAKWFLLRNMQECKFRLFATREALKNINLPSNFLSHYHLHKTAESMSEVSAFSHSDGATPTAAADIPQIPDDHGEELRFVRKEDVATDVLLSCGVQFHTETNRIVVDIYSTKLPNAQQSTVLDSIAAMGRALQLCLDDTVLHVHYFIATQRTSRQASYTPKLRQLHVAHAVSFADSLIAKAQEIKNVDLSILRRRTYSMAHVNIVHLGPLLERLCGLLQPLTPHLLTKSRNNSSVVHGFPWSWLEARQNQYDGDSDHYFFLCGFDIVADGGNGGSALQPIHPTRAHSAVHPAFALDSTTCVEMIRGTLDDTPGPSLAALYDKPKVILHINLREGVEAVAFNLKDAESLLHLIQSVLHDTTRKSAIHRDVLLQSLGFEIPCAFNEQAAASMCCGDQRNVHEPQDLNITQEVLHRGAIVSRFSRHPSLVEGSAQRGSQDTIDPKEAFPIIISGLANRGTIVNHVFPFDGAVKVLYDDSGIWSIEQCRAAVDRLISQGVFVEDKAPLFGLQQDTPSHTFVYARGKQLSNYRVAFPHTATIPHTPLIASAYHRHLQRAHIIIEARNARAKISDGVMKFERFWATRATCSKATLVRHIIQLQLKSKQVKGLRVPDFGIRTGDLTPDDLFLESTLPVMTTERQKVYCQRVDETLRLYVDYLMSVFGNSVYVVEVDPSLQEMVNDPEISARLRCRYGKVASVTGHIKFTPKLFFVVMTVDDAVHALRSHKGSQHNATTSSSEGLPAPTAAAAVADDVREHVAASSGITSGFFVVEVGFQVVNYALDYYVIGGSGPGTTDVNLAATLLKQKFLFSSVVYDLGVGRLVQQVRQRVQPLAGEQPVAMAVMNLIKFYPNPPGYSSNCAHVVPVTDPNILGLRRLLVPSSTAIDPNNPPSQVIVPHANVLRSIGTNDVYNVMGVLAWEDKPKLYILLATETMVVRARVRRRDMLYLLDQAQQVLVHQLFEATLHLRVRDIWIPTNVTPQDKATPATATPATIPQDHFQMLREHSTAEHRTLLLQPLCTEEGLTRLVTLAGLERQVRITCSSNPRTTRNHVRLRLVANSPVWTLVATPSTPSNDVRMMAGVMRAEATEDALRLQLETWRSAEGPANEAEECVEDSMEIEEMLLDALIRFAMSATWNM